MRSALILSLFVIFRGSELLQRRVTSNYSCHIKSHDGKKERTRAPAGNIILSGRDMGKHTFDMLQQ